MLQHPPYEPEELGERPPGPEFPKLLRAQQQERYPEPPPFYQLLFDGKLKPQDLQLWAKNHYYYFEPSLQFSTGAIHNKTNVEAIRSHLVKKLVTIEGREVVNDIVGWTTPAYEELWLRFGEGIGVKREDITEWRPFTRSYFAACTLAMCCRYWEWSWLDGLAALYAYDLTAKDWMTRAYEALKRHYGVTDEHLEFFQVIANDSEEDIPWEEEALSYWPCTVERKLSAARAFRYRLDIEYQYILPLFTAATEKLPPFQVP